jgi:hypothetical protein
VGGPACKIKETKGLFSKTCPVDRYVARFDPRPVESGPPTPDPMAGHACMRLGGGGRAGAGGVWRRAAARVAGVGRKRVPDHGFARGFHLHVAGAMEKLKMCLHGWFRWRSRQGIHGADGRRPASSGGACGSRRTERG